MYNTDTDDEKNMKKWRRKSRKTDVNGKITHFIEVDVSLKRMKTDLPRSSLLRNGVPQLYWNQTRKKGANFHLTGATISTETCSGPGVLQSPRTMTRKDPANPRTSLFQPHPL